jgi:starch synthase
MPRWYAEATVVVLPSVQESFGVVLIEAMASGRAVVASRVGGIPEVLADGECGLLVPPGDPGEFAQAISRLLADDHERASLAAKGRARVEAVYRSEAVVDRLIDVYAETRERYNGRRRLAAGAH